mmetsp:Transcript_13240/g.50714  ORF Transcript_13240/g.50714 Transcript_13240/m.50714 type:complete len:205 (+) Transcript_13240:508-1122(+)
MGIATSSSSGCGGATLMPRSSYTSTGPPPHTGGGASRPSASAARAASPWSFSRWKNSSRRSVASRMSATTPASTIPVAMGPTSTSTPCLPSENRYGLSSRVVLSHRMRVGMPSASSSSFTAAHAPMDTLSMSWTTSVMPMLDVVVCRSMTKSWAGLADDLGPSALSSAFARAISRGSSGEAGDARTSAENWRFKSTSTNRTLCS